MKKYILILLALFCCEVSYAHNEWIPYSPQPMPPTVYVPSTPVVTYSTQEYWIPKPTITYDWVPYYTLRTSVVERHGLLCKYRTVIQQPVIEWVYQPVWR